MEEQGAAGGSTRGADAAHRGGPVLAAGATRGTTGVAARGGAATIAVLELLLSSAATSLVPIVAFVDIELPLKKLWALGNRGRSAADRPDLPS